MMYYLAVLLPSVTSEFQILAHLDVDAVSSSYVPLLISLAELRLEYMM